MVQVVNNFDELEEDWNLIYDSELHTVFQSFSYNKLAWDLTSKKKKLYLLVYKDNQNTIQCILPTCLNTRKELRFINDHSTDFCDCILAKNVRTLDFVEELCSFIDNHKEIHSIIFENLLPSSKLLPYFKIFEKSSFVYSLNEFSYIKCKTQNEPFENFTNLNNIKKKKLRNIIRKSESLDFSIYKKGKDLPIKDLKVLFSIMVNNGLRSPYEYQSNFWHFINECYNNDILEIALLKNSDGPLSAGLVFFNEKMSVRWVIFYSETKYNLWNNVNYIKIKATDLSHDHIINFGRGGYDYKINNFKPSLGMLYAIAYSKTFVGNIRILYIINLYYIKRVFKHRIDSIGLRSRINTLGSIIHRKKLSKVDFKRSVNSIDDKT